MDNYNSCLVYITAICEILNVHTTLCSSLTLFLRMLSTLVKYWNVCFQLISNPLCIAMDRGRLRVHLVLNGEDIIVRSPDNVTDGAWYLVHLHLTNNKVTVEGMSQESIALTQLHCLQTHYLSINISANFLL